MSPAAAPPGLARLLDHLDTVEDRAERIDLLIEMLLSATTDLDAIFNRLNTDFEHGLKLVREKTGNGRFFLTRQALEDPEQYIAQLLAAQE